MAAGGRLGFTPRVICRQSLETAKSFQVPWCHIASQEVNLPGWAGHLAASKQVAQMSNPNGNNIYLYETMFLVYIGKHICSQFCWRTGEHHNHNL